MNYASEHMAEKINAQIIATTTSLSDEWNEVLHSFKLQASILCALWLETAFFGTYLLQKRFITNINEDVRTKTKQNIYEIFLSMVPGVVFEDTAEEWSVNYIKSYYQQRIKLYEDENEIDIKYLYQEMLTLIFNLTDSKIKFFESTLMNRIKLKLFGSRDCYYVPQNNLTDFVNNVVQAFANVDKADIF